MLWRLSRLPLFALLVLRVTFADSIPPRELGREVRLSRANRSVPSRLEEVGSYTTTRSLAGNVFNSSFNGSGRYALRLNGRQENRLPTRMIFVPSGDGQAYGSYGSRARSSKSFADRVLDVLLITKKGRKKGK